VNQALRFALLGDPVAHSKSPAMHHAAFLALGLPHRYELRQVTGAGLKEALADLRSGVYAGYNVTLPHKLSVMPLLDGLQYVARLAGAVNTIVREPSGKLLGHNTDVPALRHELRRLQANRVQNKPSAALVLGAGGAARAAVCALVHEGAKRVAVRNRSLARAEALIRELAFGFQERGIACHLTAESFDAESSIAAQELTCILQCSSAPLTSPSDAVWMAESQVPWNQIDAACIALDLVTSEDTAFLARARERGLACAGGAGMLVEQGALALELWLGIEAPRAAMRASLQG
jgi:shikimate dehydrogenase